ncbi:MULTISPECIES: TauD/TfdA family dioxygenase [unclassified Streptomyces]|uniref:TauD/TfdA family dioxygenase n=1 Tax=unclassified Streptomyces TaxID=2593676 RepID=UPI0013BACC99|nr:TauD/TfdA family dioxygenase [Streptomyces sp. SID14446]NEB35271.1 TauD/TfdA family dioxygenase [Streptomyces sp. SID14446]
MPSIESTISPLGLELEPGRPALLRVRDTDDPAGWAAASREGLASALAEHGAVVIRGLALHDTTDVAAVLDRLGVQPMAEKETFAARETYGPGLYSASPWPPNQPMCMHHELSYTLDPPGLLLFACLSEPTVGGATCVADAAAVLDALPGDLVDRFERDGWLLTRTYNDEIGATLTEAFGTTDRDAVEAYCRSQGISWAWQPDGSLRTAQRRRAVVRHPVDGRRCWFNQVAFLNEWTLAPEVREYLVEEYGTDGLPFNTFHGDGEPLDEDVVRLVNAAYEDHTVRTPWQAGDLLAVDNVRTAHSREAYEGPRSVVVAMASPTRLDAPPTIESGSR